MWRVWLNRWRAPQLLLAKGKGNLFQLGICLYSISHHENKRWWRQCFRVASYIGGRPRRPFATKKSAREAATA
jgi:hypothetical protein